MLILGNFMINLQYYIIIGEIFSICFLIYFTYIDFTVFGGTDIACIIKNLSEAILIGLAWIVAIPILAITNILLSIINLFTKEELEDEEE